MNFCWLIHPSILNDKLNRRTNDSSMYELKSLAISINLKIYESNIIRVNRINPGTYFGKGKIEEIKQNLCKKKIKNCIIIINSNISPIQQRNLEKVWNVKVLDRTALILEIFGARAVTKEGSLQVELAHISWQKTRLVRSWTHLERQRGGRGFLGGPGELQIELDKRHITSRIKRIKKELEKVRKTRELQRNKRKQLYPLVSLIGYTNSGKSTLFNKITGATEFTKNMVFATLDPKHRIVSLSRDDNFILSDTVGFISNLPTELIESFKSTLDEILYADLIIHVRDISHEDYYSQNEDVQSVIRQIFGYDKGEMPTNYIEVINKIDKLQVVERKQLNTKNKIYLSALTGLGINNLKKNIFDLIKNN
ncbi:MAG: GTPase HflX [Alphaproteobacteria bacterium MarineAlpha9_Bin3]|nr:MAG: GTPase HflX [Alphaproteobacteria bacterium MarineAlpha9_Bin3]|tara:strand:+ start:56481 stop:57578 length:1098 start_codon:yes stop_codon:yes gene_type:complete